MIGMDAGQAAAALRGSADQVAAGQARPPALDWVQIDGQ